MFVLIYVLAFKLKISNNKLTAMVLFFYYLYLKFLELLPEKVEVKIDNGIAGVLLPDEDEMSIADKMPELALLFKA